MPYLVDRARALRLADVVVIRSIKTGRARAQVLLKDNSVYWTATRPRTLRKAAALALPVAIAV